MTPEYAHQPRLCRGPSLGERVAKKKPTQSKSSEQSHSWMWVAVVIIVASLPLFFFENPLKLHAQDLIKGFYGIAIWPPAVMAGYAFFHNVSFGRDAQADKPWILDQGLRALATLVMIVVTVLFMAQRYQNDYVGYEHIIPWSELAIAIPMFAALKFLESLYFQGVLQQSRLAKSPRAMRIAAVGLVSLVVHIGFILAVGETGFVFRPDEFFDYVGTQVIMAVAVALCFEFGWSVWICGVIHAGLGAAFIWYQQSALL